MTDLFIVIMLISLLLLVIGIINPNISLFWYKKKRSRIISFLIYLGLAIFMFVLFGVTSDSDKESTKIEEESIVQLDSTEFTKNNNEPEKQKVIPVESEFDSSKIIIEDEITTKKKKQVSMNKLKERIQQHLKICEGKYNDYSNGIVGDDHTENRNNSELYRTIQEEMKEFPTLSDERILYGKILQISWDLYIMRKGISPNKNSNDVEVFGNSCKNGIKELKKELKRS